MSGAAQKMITNPAMSGCRTNRKRPRWVNGGGRYVPPRAGRYACRTPNRSKWLTRNVEPIAISQPAAYTTHTAHAAGPGTCHTDPPIGRQSQNSSANASAAHSTNVARSAATGTSRVQRRLNHGRAITVCWTANNESSTTSITAATGAGPPAPPSMPLGTPTSAKNPIA